MSRRDQYLVLYLARNLSQLAGDRPRVVAKSLYHFSRDAIDLAAIVHDRMAYALGLKNTVNEPAGVPLHLDGSHLGHAGDGSGKKSGAQLRRGRGVEAEGLLLLTSNLILPRDD